MEVFEEIAVHRITPASVSLATSAHQIGDAVFSIVSGGTSLSRVTANAFDAFYPPREPRLPL